MTAEEERQWKRQSQLKDALFRAGALPDWAVDQKIAAGDLVHGAGDEHRHILVQRAYAALRHLEEVEKDLPSNKPHTKRQPAGRGGRDAETERWMEIVRWNKALLGILPVHASQCRRGAGRSKGAYDSTNGHGVQRH